VSYPSDEDLVIRVNPESPSKTIEIARSFSFKLNLGNYQSCDFFTSRKEVCLADEADTVSADIFEWCYEQVMEEVKEVKRKQAAKTSRGAA
jgi:hypothetical protein